MKNTTMTMKIVPMSMSHARVVERSQTAHLLAPIFGAAWGTTLSADAPIQAIQGGHARGRAAGYGPSVTTSVNTTLTTLFTNDVDDLRSGRPPV